MPGLPIGRRGVAVGTVLFSAVIACVPAAATELRSLAVPDPATETAAPADAGLTAACQSGTRERFGQEKLAFGQPSHTARDGLRIVRMDMTVSGQAFRAVCIRDGAAGPVEAVVFAAPVGETGPRVIVLPGPTPETQPRADDRGYRLVARSNEEPVFYEGYGGFAPGLWVPPFDGRLRFGSRAFARDGSHVLVKRGSGAIEITRDSGARFVEIRRGSSAPFSSGGIASPAISNFSPKAVRGGGVRLRSGGIASPGIGGFGR